MGIKPLYNDNLRKLPNAYGDVSVMVYKMKLSVNKCEIKGVQFFLRNDAFWRNLICITYTFSTGVISGSFLRYRMQVTEKHNCMDIFYINYFSHSLYLSRARNISCFSCFLTIVYAIYSRNCIHLRKTEKQKRRVDTYKAKENRAECRGDV